MAQAPPYFFEYLVSSQVIYSTVHFMAFHHFNNNGCQGTKNPKLANNVIKQKQSMHVLDICSPTLSLLSVQITPPSISMWTLAGLEIFRNILHLFSKYFFCNELLTQLLSYLALVPPILPPHSGKKCGNLLGNLVSESRLSFGGRGQTEKGH